MNAPPPLHLPPPARVPSRRDSSADWLRDVPRTIKVLAIIVPTAFGFAGAVGGGALAYDGLATDAEVARAIDAHDKRARAREPEDSPHPQYAKALAALEAAALAADNRDKAQRARDVALFKRLVSLEAADMEPDKRRAAEAAAFARRAYLDAVATGLEPADAAESAIDSRPPWRR